MRYFIILLLFLAACGDEAQVSTVASLDDPRLEDSPELIPPENFNQDQEPPQTDEPQTDEEDETPSAPPPGQAACIKGLNSDLLLAFAIEEGLFHTKSCRSASSRQIAEVERGNQKIDEFLTNCYEQTGNSCWCDQLTRPNPNSINTFYCTYPNDMPHQLIHPDQGTWKHAVEAVKIIQDLEAKNINVSIIYNWWRPEPYNKNVGGSPTRHPYGHSVDVRFATKADQNRAHRELCKMRKRGRLRAIGYYSSPSLHFGIGDRRANTWGKSCP